MKQGLCIIKCYKGYKKSDFELLTIPGSFFSFSPYIYMVKKNNFNTMFMHFFVLESLKYNLNLL